MKVRHGWRRIRCLGWGQSEFGDERGDKWPTPRSPANAPGRLQPPAKSGGPGCQRGQRLSARSLTGGSLVFSEWPLGEGRRDELKESLQGVERGRRRERGCRGRGGPAPGGWMKRMEPAGRAGGRQCALAVHSHCGRHTVCLRPSGPQRQSRLSVGRLSAAPGSPTSGPLGPANLSRVAGGSWLGWGRGVGRAASSPF